MRALGNQFPLEFRQRRKNPKEQPSVRGGRIDLCTCTGQYFQSDVASTQFVYRRERVYSECRPA
jgi:hypothetical protein